MGLFNLVFEGLDALRAEREAERLRLYQEARQRAERAANDRRERRTRDFADGAAFARRCLRAGPLYLVENGEEITRHAFGRGSAFHAGFVDVMAEASCRLPESQRAAPSAAA